MSWEINNLDRPKSEDNMEIQCHFLEICLVGSYIKSQHDTNSDIRLIDFSKAVMERLMQKENL